MPEIRFDSVSVAVPGESQDDPDQVIIDDVSLTLTEQRIGIIGANGSGKSTLTRLINGLGSPSSGRVTVDGLDVDKNGKKVREKVGFVFSDAENQIVMPQVFDDVAFSLRRFKLSREERNRRVDAALQRFGLRDHATDSPHTLSGGQKQLLALAAVWVIEPELIIADEPTTLLDLRNRRRLVKEFTRLEQQLIVVTHDLDILSGFDRCICVNSGAIAADGRPNEVIEFYKDLIDKEPL